MFKLPISNVNNLCCQEAWNWGGIFKRTDDHTFEKTMKIELSPIPQAYTLKSLTYYKVNKYWGTIWFIAVFNDILTAVVIWGWSVDFNMFHTVTILPYFCCNGSDHGEKWYTLIKEIALVLLCLKTEFTIGYRL